MQLPRRIPWASLSELEQLCSLIYSDETDLHSKQLAVNKLSAWKSITQLSHALESTLGLLTVTLQDSSASQPSSSAVLSGYNLRQCYSTAIIRLVNGLVDPLQSGVYARSIASIAAQLGLPAWLVEVRHAATHEELPSLGVLRDAAHESLRWLFHNYFMPELHPSSAESDRRQPLRSAAHLLKKYSVLMKIVTRDTSLRQKHQPEIDSVLRDVERWIAEAKTAVDISSGNIGWEGAEWDDSTVNSEQEVKERLALEALCGNLMEKGALVPLAKKKRVLDARSFHPLRAVTSIWTPLIQHIESLHAGFIPILVTQLASQLFNEPAAPAPGTPPARDSSYDSFIAAWAVYLLDTQTLSTGDEGVDQRLITRANIIPLVVGGLGPLGLSTLSERKTVKAFLDELCKRDVRLAEICTTLNEAPQYVQEWKDSDLEVMNERLGTLFSHSHPSAPAPTLHPTPEMTNVASDSPCVDRKLPPGWSVPGPNSGWRPSPIGVYVPCKT